MKLKSGRRVVFRRERYILVGLLACMFLCSVGYAILSQQIKINGISSISTNFDIYIESITENSLTNAETVGEPSITNKTSGRIEVNLNEKGAKAIYDVTVRNVGNVDALITAIEGIEEANQQEPIDITVSTSGLQLYSSLLQGETMTFQIVVMWDGSITTTSSAENKTIDFTVEYQQKTADSPTFDPGVQFALGDHVKVLGLTDAFRVVNIDGDMLYLLSDRAIAYSKYDGSAVFEESNVYKTLQNMTSGWRNQISSAGGSTLGYNVTLMSQQELLNFMWAMDVDWDGNTYYVRGSKVEWLIDYDFAYDHNNVGQFGFLTSTVIGDKLVNFVAYRKDATNNQATFLQVGNFYIYGMDIRPCLTIDKASVSKIE